MKLNDRQLQQVGDAIIGAKLRWGAAGWSRLSTDMRQAYVARECLALFMAQDESTQTPACFARLIAVAEAALAEVDS